MIRQGDAVARRTVESEQVTLAAAQGDPSGGLTITPAEVAAASRVYDQLSHLPRPADLLVWPETAVPTALQTAGGQLEHYGQQVAETARREGTWLLTGALHPVGEQIYNGAHLFSPTGELTDTYHKNDLVIFGEYVPCRNRLSLYQHYPVRQRDFTPGRERKVMAAGPLRVAPLICFEAIFPEPTREVTRLGAEVVVIHTSDLWAGKGLEVQLHSQTGVYRAIESRRPVVRAASNGLTVIYNPWGEVLDEVPLYQPGLALAEVPRPATRLSLYHQYGDWPLLILSIIGVVLSLLVRLPRFPDE